MLLLSQSFIDRPVLSLRTGGPIATITSAVINPNNLKIEGFICQDRVEKKKQLILLTQDIRDIIAQGIVVNDHEVLAKPDELIRLKDILKVNFVLIGKPVVTVSKSRLGKVSDYAADDTSLFIQKIYASQSVLKNLSGGSISVDRSQIVEITNRKIVVQDLLKVEPAVAPAPVPVS